MNNATGISRRSIRIREGFGAVHPLLACLLVLGALFLLPAMAGAAYTDHGDGTVTDSATGLMWKRCGEGQTWAGGTCTGALAIYNWTQATALTNTVTYAGHNDWRLPALSELTTLITGTTYSPTISSIDATAFPNHNLNDFWSSTPDTGNTANAMFVNFVFGVSAPFAKSNTIAAHLVRGGAGTPPDGDPDSGDISVTQSLQLGWNLLGNNLDKTLSVATLYGDAALVATVWKWNAATSSWQFYSPALTAAELAQYAAGKGYGVLSEINPGDGYWVNAKATVTLPAQSGPPFSLSDDDLAVGWNLVSTADDISPGDLNRKLNNSPPGVEGTPDSFTTLWAWDLPTAKWYFYAPSLEAEGTLSSYIAEKGYLDFSTNNKTLGKGIGFWVNKSGSATVVTSPTLTLSMTKEDGVTPVTSVTSTNPALVTATLVDTNGNPVANAIVTFSVDPIYGAFAGSNAALTDTSGRATVKLTTPNTEGGASTVTANATVNDQSVSESLNFAIGSTVLSLSAIEVPAEALSAYGTVNISVNVLSNGTPYTTPIAVSFTSACAASGKATLTPSVTTVNGTATASYLDNGCNNADPGDTITATLNGVTATANLKVSSPAIGSLQFVSVATNPATTPPMITLKGTGGANKSESARVTFRVVDSAGNPLGNTLVNFSLNTTLGGLKLTALQASSDPTTGNVVTYVQAGTMSTVVRVTATTGELYTQSDLLYISTGIPAQDSISLSASKLNFEGWNYDGETTDLTVHLADHFHNPVLDGTAVYFTSEGGAVAAGCTTVNNACTVQLTSQALRPNNGRVTVMARATGEEAFIDLNSNGTVDDASEMIDANFNSTDIGEAYLDFNEDGIRDGTAEPFIDFNGNGLYDGSTLGGFVGATSTGDGKYNGLLCTANAAICGQQKSMDVRDSVVVVFSTSEPYVDLQDADGVIALPPCDPIAKTSGGSASVTVTVVDLHGNALPVGTTVEFTADSAEITSKSSWVVPNTTGCRSDFPGCPPTVGSPTFGDYWLVMKSDGVYDETKGTCTNEQAGGSLAVTVTTPKGLATTYSFYVTD